MSDVQSKIRAAVAQAVGADDIAKADRASTKMLLAMSRLGKPFYQGTVPQVVVARRRAKSRAARVARRAHR